MKSLFRLFVVVLFLVAAVFAATPATQGTYHEGTLPRPRPTCQPGEICGLQAANHEGTLPRPRPTCQPGEICGLQAANHEGTLPRPRPTCQPGEICAL